MAYEVEEKVIQAQPALVIRVQTTPDKIGETYRSLFPQVTAYCQERGIQTAGPPFSQYHEYGEEGVDMSAGIPVVLPAEGEGQIAAHELPGGTVAATWHVGPYTTISGAYDAIAAWIEEQGRRRAGAPWES